MRGFIVIICLLSTQLVSAQGKLGLYQLQKDVPQASFVNPAFESNSKVVIGLPIISSAQFGLGSPLSFNDVFVRDADDSLRLDSNTIIDQLKNSNKVDLNGSIGLIYLGVNTKIGQFTLSYNSIADGAISIPGDLIEFALSGTEDPNEYKRLTLNETDFQVSIYNEWGLGFSRAVTDKLYVGGRIKFIQGLANASLENLNGVIETNIDSINISADPWVFHTSGISELEDFSRKYFFRSGNSGIGLDLGATYQLNDDLIISGSILDIGGITWKNDTKSYYFDGVDYTFDGINLLNYLENGNDEIEQELDSLENLFKPEQVEGETYSTALISKFYVGATYQLARINTFGFVVSGEVFKSSIRPLVGLTYNIQLGRILNLGVNYSYRNQSFKNFGATLATKFGPIQIYLIADSFETLIFQAADARLLSFHGGLNILLGKKD